MNSRITLIAVALAGALAAPPAPAQQAVDVEASPDVALTLAGQAVTDHELALDDTSGTVAALAFPGLPGGADVDAHTVDADGNDLISLDTTALLPAAAGGHMIVRPADVARLRGAGYELVFAGELEGLPAGVNVDAVYAHGGELFLSLDVTARLPDGSVADDEDVIRWDGEALSLYRDLSELGLDGAADLDALHFIETTGALVASFETGGRAGTAVYDDDDLMLREPLGGAWSAAFDGDAAHAAWSAGDIDAATPGFDIDDDGVLDADDLCPHFADPVQSDVDGNGIGDPCECGDQTGDGTVDVADLLAINQVIFGVIPASPLCDTNEDGACDVGDILGANAKIFGAPAYCSRYPGPVFP